MPSGKCGADLLADVEHGRFVALAFADDDGAVHRHRVHVFAHGFGRDLVGQPAVALSHGVGRRHRGVFDDPQKFQRQIGFNVAPELLG